MTAQIVNKCGVVRHWCLPAGRFIAFSDGSSLVTSLFFFLFCLPWQLLTKTYVYAAFHGLCCLLTSILTQLHQALWAFYVVVDFYYIHLEAFIQSCEASLPRVPLFTAESTDKVDQNKYMNHLFQAWSRRSTSVARKQGAELWPDFNLAPPTSFVSYFS